MTLDDLSEADILNLKAGPELDALVEVHVMGREVICDRHGCYWVKGDHGLLGNNPPKPYSTDGNAMLEAWHRLRALGWMVELVQRPDQDMCRIILRYLTDGSIRAVIRAEAGSLPHAVALAALLAMKKGG